MALDVFIVGIKNTVAGELGITVVDGKIEGPLELPVDNERARGCIWPEATAEVEENVYREDLGVFVRVFLPIQQQESAEEPLPSLPLVALRTEIINALKPHQDSQFGVEFFRVERFEFDLARQCVTAGIVGRQFAEFMQGLGG